MIKCQLIELKNILMWMYVPNNSLCTSRVMPRWNWGVRALFFTQDVVREKKEPFSELDSWQTETTPHNTSNTQNTGNKKAGQNWERDYVWCDKNGGKT